MFVCDALRFPFTEAQELHCQMLQSLSEGCLWRYKANMQCGQCQLVEGLCVFTGVLDLP